MDGLTKAEFLVVKNLLSATRNSPTDKISLDKDETDLRECINAIHIAGYVIVPKGMIDSIRAVVNRVR